MTEDEVQGLVSPSDIAEIAGFSRGAVSNWRKRKSGFPDPVAGTATRPLFSRKDVLEWIAGHSEDLAESAASRDPKAHAEMELWSAMNDVRGDVRVEEAAEALLALAATRVAGRAPESAETRVSHAVSARLADAISRVDSAELAGAIDSVLERSARAQGKVVGEHGFVGSHVAMLLGDLASTMPGGTLYDPACGIGAAMIEAIARGATPSRVVGHELNSRAVWIAEQRAVLHGVSLETSLADVLAEDPDPELSADVILLEPPFGRRLHAPNSVTDPRFVFGTPPQSSSETAWLQHAIAHLTVSGRAYVVTPMGSLFRGGDEARIRAELILRGCVETVVELPGKLLPQTTIALALWVLRRPVPEPGSESILFIDASDEPEPWDSIRNWLDDPVALEAVPHARVPIPHLLAAESVLTPSRWVAVEGPDPEETAAQFGKQWDALDATAKDLQRVLESTRAVASFPPARVTTIRDLAEQGVVELRMGRMASRYEDEPDDVRARIVTVRDVQNGGLTSAALHSSHGKEAGLTREGDILVVTMNGVRACVDEAGGHLPVGGVYSIRVKDHGVISPGYLAIVLRGEWNSRFQHGVAQQRAPIKDLEVPLMPLVHQRELESAVNSLQALHDAGAELSSQASSVISTLLDAVRYSVPLREAATDVDVQPHVGRDAGEGLT